MIKYFTVYGERCSGTNFLENAILQNFDIERVWHYQYKHFFGYYDFSEQNPIIENDDDVLFLGIIRDPVYWINSLFQKKHHLPEENKQSIQSFLKNEFYSIDEEGNEILNDRHIITHERYKNIFELRYVKNNFLIDTMKKQVKNYLLIRYEDLNNHYETLLEFLEKKFQLKRKTNTWVKINNYKGNSNKLYVQNNIQLSPKIIKRIRNTLDKNQEHSLGYL